MLKLSASASPRHNSVIVDFSTKTHTGGEEHVVLYAPDPALQAYTIEALYPSSAEFMQIVLLVDAIRHINRRAFITLRLPYLPYARQDRVCAEGESASLTAFCNIIRGLRVQVESWDTHSYVAEALLSTNLTKVSQLDCLINVAKEQEELAHMLASGCSIIAPDAGSAKKAAEIAWHYAVPLYICSKSRGADGEPTLYLPSEAIAAHNPLIVDDICDGGRTFANLARELNNPPALYVTHAIMSSNAEANLRECLSSMFCATHKPTYGFNKQIF
jgi:ribose-phosphate pyrophosphokinase